MRSPRFTRGGVLPSALKTNGSELRSLPAISGESVKGGYPLSQDGNDQSELAAARRRRAREFRLPARSAGRIPDGAPTPSRTTTESYSGSWPRPGTARPRAPVGDRRSKRSPRSMRSPRFTRTAERAKNKWQRTPFAARDFGGKCERGAYSIPGTANRNCHCAPTGAVPKRAKNKWQRTPFAARDFGGKCERGLPPFTRR